MTGTFRNTIVATVAALAITGTALTPVLAATDSNGGDAVVQAAKTGAANPKLALSADGNTLMRAVRAARIAIFNGDTAMANNMVKKAQAALKRVKSDDTVVKGKGGKEIDANWVPIDGQLVVADSFTDNPERAAHIAKGNQKIKEGKADEALQELKLANVDVGFSRIMMPLQETADHLNLAAKEIKGEDYYQANLALKAIEDGLNVETAMLVEVPKDGANNAKAASNAGAAKATDAATTPSTKTN